MNQLKGIAFIAAACLVGACSGSNTQPFIGTWTVASGNGSLTTGTGANQQTAPGGTTVPIQGYSIIFAQGTTSDLASLDNVGCKLLWSVSGSTATVLPNQTCTITVSGATSTFTLGTGTISLAVTDSSHLSGTGNITGNCTFPAGGAQSGACSAQAVGALSLVSH
jgi:hypothetical protein